MALKLLPAAVDDAPALAELQTAAAEHLTRLHGVGPWSSRTSEKGVLFVMRNSRVFLAREDREILATVRLTTKKPWAIDPDYFTPCKNPLYLVGITVAPAHQRQGIGRGCLREALRIAQAWPADALRLDAYDAPAGAGPFYARNGFNEVGRVTYRLCPLIYYELLAAQFPRAEQLGS